MVFEYLTVLISVVVGLSVTSFLTNIVRIIHVRGDVTVSWVQLLWSIVILMWTVAFWWFTFVLAEETQWTFRLFIFLLTYSTFLFLLMALLFPEGVPSDHDYQAQFMRNRVWFFGVFLLFLCLDLLDYWIKLEKDVSIASSLQYAAFIGPMIVLSLIGLRTANLLFHTVFAAYALLAVLAMSANTLLPLTS
jgi:hypothetical protein